MGPLISCSSVDGKGLDLVKQMLHTLNQNNQWAWGESLPFEFEIDDIWQISVGCIVGGTISSGSISAGDTAWLGPDREGNFVRVQVSSIHLRRQPTQFASSGQSVSLLLRSMDNNNLSSTTLRSGMFLVEDSE